MESRTLFAETPPVKLFFIKEVMIRLKKNFIIGILSPENI